MMNRFCLVLLCVPALGLSAAACSSTTTATGNAPDSGGVDPDGGTVDAEGGGGGGTMCTMARDEALVPIDKVWTGGVTVVSDTGGIKTLYVDASAGNVPTEYIKNPRIYIDLGAGTKVALTDVAAPMSSAWDLALKRDKIFTNSGDAGVGVGGAVQIEKPFASVTAAEAGAASLFKEKFFDSDCNLQVDVLNTFNTTFADWYDYDQTTHIPTPKDVTYVVAGGTGKKYKVAIKSYSGLADGGTGMATGFYLLQVSAL